MPRESNTVASFGRIVLGSEVFDCRLAYMQDSLPLLDNFIKQSGGYTGADGQPAWTPALCLIAV